MTRRAATLTGILGLVAAASQIQNTTTNGTDTTIPVVSSVQLTDVKHALSYSNNGYKIDVFTASHPKDVHIDSKEKQTHLNDTEKQFNRLKKILDAQARVHDVYLEHAGFGNSFHHGLHDQLPEIDRLVSRPIADTIRTLERTHRGIIQHKTPRSKIPQPPIVAAGKHPTPIHTPEKLCGYVLEKYRYDIYDKLDPSGPEIPSSDADSTRIGTNVPENSLPKHHHYRVSRWYLSHSPPTNRRLPPCSVPYWARISGCDATLGLDTSHSEITTLDASSLGSISVSASPTWILAGPASTQTTGKTTTLVTQSSKTTLVQSVSTSSIVATSATPSTMMSVVRERAPIWRERNDIHKPMSFLRSAPTPAHPAWNQDTPALT